MEWTDIITKGISPRRIDEFQKITSSLNSVLSLEERINAQRE